MEYRIYESMKEMASNIHDLVTSKKEEVAIVLDETRTMLLVEELILCGLNICSIDSIGADEDSYYIVCVSDDAFGSIVVAKIPDIDVKIRFKDYICRAFVHKSVPNEVEHEYGNARIENFCFGYESKKEKVVEEKDISTADDNVNECTCTNMCNNCESCNIKIEEDDDGEMHGFHMTKGTYDNFTSYSFYSTEDFDLDKIINLFMKY